MSVENVREWDRPMWCHEGLSGEQEDQQYHCAECGGDVRRELVWEEQVKDDE